MGLVEPRDPDLVRPDVADDDVLRPERAAKVDERLLRLDRPAVIVIEGLQVAEEGGAQVLVDERLARGVPFARAATADSLWQDRGEQPPERPLDVANELDLGLVVGVD